MKAFFQKNHRLFFYGSWLLIGIIQAYFTELQDDEAYYWVYSKFLAWGYFDHPPMIALLIKCGYAIFRNTLGVRLFPLLLNTLTLVITEKLIRQKDAFLFYGICLSVAALQVAGFWAVPDTPLLFFTALFFYSYKKFIGRSSFVNTFFLGLCTALLFYSKYHGLLVVFFTVLSNLKLVKQPKTYVTGIITLLLFLPHLWWQSQHDWISFRFQLFENNVHPYQVNFTSDYLLGQVLVVGPIAGIILLYSTFAYKPIDALERALKYTAVGVLLFFLLNSLRGIVEANWTAPAIIPMLVLTHQYLKVHSKWRIWLFRLLPITLVIVFIARILMVADIVPVPAVVERFHAWKDWPQALKKKTSNLTVVFNNSYQRASKYWFYTGQPTYSLNDYKERRNNYNYWPVEDSMLGKAVYNMDIYNTQLYTDSVQARLWKVGFSKNNDFLSFAKVVIVPSQRSYTTKENSAITINFRTIIPAYYYHFLQQHTNVDEPVKIGFFDVENNWLKDINCPFTLRELLTQPDRQITITPALNKGTYVMRFAIGTNTFYYTHNSNKIRLQVE